jgi:hypothetical protein
MPIQPLDKKTTFVLALSLVICGGLYIAGTSGQFKPTPDGSLYFGFAQSLAQGDGFRFNGYDQCVAPPLTSLMLTGWIFISNRLAEPTLAVWMSKLWLIFLVFLTAAGTWRLAIRYVNNVTAAIIGLMVTAHIGMFQSCMFIHSEVGYACLSVWVLALLDQNANRRNWIIGGGLMAMALLSRIVGIGLVAALILWWIFGRWQEGQRRKTLLRISLISVLSIGLYAIWKVKFGSPEKGYFDILCAVADKPDFWSVLYHDLVRNLGVIITRNVQMILNIETYDMPFYYSVILFTLISLGWILQFVQRRSLTEWYLFVYYGIMLFWSYDEGTRYFLPILPLQIIYAITAIQWMAKKLGRQRLWLLRSAAVVMFILLGWPLVEGTLSIGQSKGFTDGVRNGYVYLLPIGVAVIGIALGIRHKVFLTLSAVRMISICFLLVYLVTGWLYFAGYAALEHRLVTSREPMLLGYNSYYLMGQWLGEQMDVNEPVLCGNQSIICLASGKITRLPAANQDDTINRIDEGQFGSVLVLAEPAPQTVIMDPYNHQINRIIDSYKDDFNLIAHDDDRGFLLYRLVGALNR